MFFRPSVKRSAALRAERGTSLHVTTAPEQGSTFFKGQPGAYPSGGSAGLLVEQVVQGAEVFPNGAQDLTVIGLLWVGRGEPVFFFTFFQPFLRPSNGEPFLVQEPFDFQQGLDVSAAIEPVS